MKAEVLPSIQNLIKERIYKRVFICLFFVFFSFSLATAYDVYSGIPLLKEKLISISSDASEFIISQILLDNEGSIPAQLTEDGDENKIKIEWNKFYLKNKERGLKWIPPFSWEYSQEVSSIDGRNYGSIYIYGSLLNDDVFVEHIISKLALSLFSIFFVLFCLRPLSRKIPNDLFLKPINYVISFIKKGCIDSDAIMINECGTKEIYHLAKHFSKLIALEKEHTKEHALIEFSKQIAHDIRSPVSAILALSSEFSFLPEELRAPLRNAARRIDSIANKLLYFSGDRSYLEKNSTFLLSSAVLSVISEKEILCRKMGINLAININKGLEFLFIISNLCDFQRMLSNIINNSIEAISGSGTITLNIFLENSYIYIAVVDTGKGMSTETINDILSGKIVTEKESGFGMGLSYSRKFLRSQGGDINITSIVDIGTTVKIKLKAGDKPSWICDKVSVYKKGVIVVLDDDDYAHSLWLNFFSEEINKNDLKIAHFKKSVEFINYIFSLTDFEKRSIVCFIDYDLIGQGVSGLDIIKILKPISSILVTGFYEEPSVIKNAILLNVKIIPKNLVSYVQKTFISGIEGNHKNLSEIVLLDDSLEITEMLQSLCKLKNVNIDMYNDTYQFFDKIDLYNKNKTKVCLDYNLSPFVNGLEVAETLFFKGFRNLYLVSGSEFREKDIPEYIKILPSKTSIFSFAT